MNYNRNNFLAKNLVTVRELCNYTQRYVAKKAGVSRSAYSYWERGLYEPSYDRLLNLINFYNEDAFLPRKLDFDLMLTIDLKILL